jgi:hypothetical protein
MKTQNVAYKERKKEKERKCVSFVWGYIFLNNQSARKNSEKTPPLKNNKKWIVLLLSALLSDLQTKHSSSGHGQQHHLI